MKRSGYKQKRWLRMKGSGDEQKRWEVVGIFKRGDFQMLVLCGTILKESDGFICLYVFYV